MLTDRVSGGQNLNGGQEYFHRASYVTSVEHRRQNMIITLTVVLWFIWKEHPDVLICTAFWLSVIWVIRRRLIRHAGGFVVLLGVVLNALVTELNDGVMPVVGMPTHFHPATPLWCAAQSSNHWLLLADHASLRFFSIGDLVLIVGCALFMFSKVAPEVDKAAAILLTRCIAIFHQPCC